MWSRVVVVTGAVAGSPLLFSRVYAADVQQNTRSNRVKVSELSIYADASPAPLEYMPEELSGFRQGMSSCRKAVWGYWDSIQEPVNKVRSKWAVTKASAKAINRFFGNGIHYIQEDSGAIPRAALITVAGLGGVIAGYRGGYMRKGLFAGVGMLGAAAVCYPHQAVDVTGLAWGRMSEEARAKITSLTGGQGLGSIWKPAGEAPMSEPAKKLQVTAKPEVEEEKPAEKSEEKGKENKEENVKKVTAKKGKPVKVDKSLMDHGQSRPEDKDMYSTRSS